MAEKTEKKIVPAGEETAKKKTAVKTAAKKTAAETDRTAKRVVKEAEGTEKKVVKAADTAEKKVTKVSSTAKDEVKKAETTVKKVVEDDAKAEKKTNYKQAKSGGSATGYRVGAVILWILALVTETLGILMLCGKLNITFCSTLTAIIGVLVIDLIFVIIAALLWKKSNDIDPASKKNKVKFWLWNNLGLIMNIICFLPLLILILSNKNLDKKTKTIGGIVAAVCLLVGGAVSYDWNPVSAEEKAQAESVIEGKVYYTPFGKCYHTSPNCSSLNNSDTVYEAESVEVAIENNRNKLCSFCAKRDNISNVRTDDKSVGDADLTLNTDDVDVTQVESEADDSDAA